MNDGKKYALLLCYLALTIILVVNAFTHFQQDGDGFISTTFFISQGLVPHQDFFSPHPLFQNYLLAPLSWLAGQSPSILTIYNLLAIVLVLICARLTYTIAKRNGFQNPHAASLLFLAGYTAVTSYFLRYDFWEVLFLLLFFWFKKPLWKGFMLGLLLLMTPVFVFPTGILISTYLLTNFWHDKKKAIEPSLGIALGIVLVALVHIRIPISALIYDVIQWNSALGNYYGVPWMEAVFFSLVYIMAALIIGGIVIFKYLRTKNIALLAASYTSAYVIQIVLMNIVYGPFTRVKLPAAVPIIALMVIFAAYYKPRLASLIIIAHLLLTLLAYTPSLAMPQLEFVEVSQTLNSCVAPDATMMYDQTPPNNVPRIPLLRQPSDYHWFLRHWFPRLNITLPEHQFQERLYLCGNTIERSDFVCTSNELEQLQTLCNNFLLPASIWANIRGDIRAFLFG